MKNKKRLYADWKTYSVFNNPFYILYDVLICPVLVVTAYLLSRSEIPMNYLKLIKTANTWSLTAFQLIIYLLVTYMMKGSDMFLPEYNLLSSTIFSMLSWLLILNPLLYKIFNRNTPEEEENE